jgi:histidinol-phosphatase
VTGTTVRGSASATFGCEWSATLRRGSERELASWLDFAQSACDEADAVSLAAFDRALVVTSKAPGDFVTDADLAVETLIRDRIRRAFPAHGVLGEEYGNDAPRDNVRWILDPIDGTHNFMRHVPVFATLLAAEQDGEVQVGVVSAPALGRRWFAWRGGGAWEVSSAAAPGRPPGGGWSPARRLNVSEIGHLADGQVFHGTLRLMAGHGQRDGLLAVVDQAWRDRGFGDFWGYMLLAGGCGEAMVETGLGAWDLAAPRIIVEEAGGRITDFDGRRLPDGDAVATNGFVHDEVLALLGKHSGRERRPDADARSSIIAADPDPALEPPAERNRDLFDEVGP